MSGDGRASLGCVPRRNAGRSKLTHISRNRRTRENDDCGASEDDQPKTKAPVRGRIFLAVPDPSL